MKLARLGYVLIPKFWTSAHSQSAGLVGRGIRQPVLWRGTRDTWKCGLFTAQSDHVNALQSWFDGVWKPADPLERTLGQYLSKYQKIEAARKSVKAMIEAETNETGR